MTEPEIAGQLILGASTLIAGLGGFVVSGFTEFYRNKRIDEREKVARVELRHSEREGRTRKFQLDNLLQLQEALQQMARSISKSLHFDHIQARQSQYGFLPEGIDEELLKNSINVRLFCERVLDDGIRVAVEKCFVFGSRLNKIPLILKSMNAVERESYMVNKMIELNNVFDETLKLVGTQIRVLLRA